MLASNRTYAVDRTDDPFDRAVAGAWILSEIAIDVFGMFFWSALALFLLASLG